MFCKNCGNALDDNAKFCTACGANMRPVDDGAMVFEAQPTVIMSAADEQEKESLASSTLTKGILSLVFAELPILSILAIIFGSQAVKKGVKFADLFGRRTGKVQVGYIFGIVGKILGIVMTVFWPIYIIYIIVVVVGLFAGYDTGYGDYGYEFYKMMNMF